MNIVHPEDCKEFGGGWIGQIATRAVNAARERREPVSFKFRGWIITVDGTEDPGQVASAYMKLATDARDRRAPYSQTVDGNDVPL